jgi:thiamine-phosphate pyrophosphorylase
LSRLNTRVRLALIADLSFVGQERIESLIVESLPRRCHGQVMVIDRDKTQERAARSDRMRLARLRRLRQLTTEREALLVVNHRVDLAQACGADGVHLPGNGLPITVVRALYPSMLVGRSCHSRSGLEAAEQHGADWTFLSPIAQPLSKASAIPPLGVDGFREMIRDSKIPVFALGGIVPSLLEPLIKSGARGVAVIGHVLGAPNPAMALQQLLSDC